MSVGRLLCICVYVCGFGAMEPEGTPQGQSVHPPPGPWVTDDMLLLLMCVCTICIGLCMWDVIAKTRTEIVLDNNKLELVYECSGVFKAENFISLIK